VKPQRLVFSDAAIADIVEQFDWYADQAGRNVAKRWEAAVSAALLRIAKRPAAGSLCNFGAEELRGTRRISIARFPKHLIFYQVREGEIVVLRIVHGARDLEVLFSSRHAGLK
jgi:toxin ParE1/3/4